MHSQIARFRNLFSLFLINNLQFQYQRNRIKKYLEELYVRQAEFEYCESDDCIAFYTQTSPTEKKIVYSSDRDLVQLINDEVILYNPSHRRVYSKNDIMPYDHEEVLIENVKLIKILCGDPSDNIFGIKNLGIKRLIGLFPEIKTKQLTLQEVRNQGNLIFESDNFLIYLIQYLFGDLFNFDLIDILYGLFLTNI